MRLPPSSLLREILSLLLHESIHMGGGQEPEAVEWQTLFSKYFGARFGDLSAESFSAETLKAMGVARVFLARATELARANSRDPRLFAQMGKFAQSLDSLPELRDPLAFELKLKPRSLERIAEYTKAVLSLIQEVQLKFEINNDNLRITGIRVPLEFMPPEKVVPTLSEVSAKFETINELFLQMAGRSEIERPTCRSSEKTAVVPVRGHDDVQEFPPNCDDI